MTDADHLLAAAAWLRAFPHLPTMREGVKHEHAQWAETLERLAARLPRLVEIAPEDAAGYMRDEDSDTYHQYGPRVRVEQALRAHAGKAAR
jgi:hypothetical protein